MASVLPGSDGTMNSRSLRVLAARPRGNSENSAAKRRLGGVVSFDGNRAGSHPNETKIQMAAEFVGSVLALLAIPVLLFPFRSLDRWSNAPLAPYPEEDQSLPD